jgi:predicted phosphodiesterase
MRLALIADIHGNLPALEAVLSEVERERVDELICLGDVALGPQPVDTLERLRALGCPVTMGNWDAWFFQQMPSLDGDLGRVLGDLRSWAIEQLSSDHRRYVLGFDQTLEVDLGSGASLLGFHGSPRSFEDMILATTSDAELERMLDGHTALILAGGHTHFQLFRRFGESAVVNPGSVGLPFRRGEAGVMRISPWAEYGLVDYEEGRLAVELRRTAFDVESFLALMLQSGMPHAEWWADLWRDKPTAEEAGSEKLA